MNFSARDESFPHRLLGLGMPAGVLLLSASVAEAADEPEVRDEADHDSASSSAEARPSYRALEATLGVPFWSRNLSYNDNLSRLRPHSIGPAPTVGGGLRWYPGAHATSGVGAHLGLELSGMKSIGLSTRKDGVTYDTDVADYSIGVRGRVPLGVHELTIVSGYGSVGIAIDEPEDSEAVPDVEYGFLYVGSEASFTISDQWRLGLRLAYLPVFSTGELGDEPWFPRSTERGVEGALSISRDVTDFLAVTAGARLRRFGFSMNPEPGDEQSLPIAGGAVDQQVSGFIGVTGFLNGVTRQ